MEWGSSVFHHVWGVHVSQVFQECGVPPKAMARSRRAPAPIEEMGRLWTSAAGVEEERPTTAAGNSLPRMVSGGADRIRVLGGRTSAATPPALFARPGVGAAGAAGPGPGLLGRAAPGCVRRPPHGSGHHAGGGALLDRNRAGPVRARQTGGRPESRGGEDPQGPAGALGAAVLAGTCCRWSGTP